MLPCSCWEAGPLHDSKVSCVHQRQGDDSSQRCRWSFTQLRFGHQEVILTLQYPSPFHCILFYLFIFASSWGCIVSREGPGQRLAQAVQPSPAKTPPPFSILNSIPIFTKNSWQPRGSDLHSVFHDNHLFLLDLQRSLDNAWYSLALNESFHHLFLGNIIQY